MSSLELTKGTWELQRHGVNCSLNRMLKGIAEISCHKPPKATLGMAGAQGNFDAGHPATSCQTSLEIERAQEDGNSILPEAATGRLGHG